LPADVHAKRLAFLVLDKSMTPKQWPKWFANLTGDEFNRGTPLRLKVEVNEGSIALYEMPSSKKLTIGIDKKSMMRKLQAYHIGSLCLTVECAHKCLPQDLAGMIVFSVERRT